MWERYGAWKSTVLAIFILLIQGCSSSGDSEQPPVTIAGEEEIDIELSGSVGDGPVASALITVFSKTGEVLATAIGDNAAGYNVQLRTKGKHYPLTVEADGGIDLVSGAPLDFVMVSTLTEPRNKSVAHVNPYSTLAVHVAKRMIGGLSAQSLAAATDAVVQAFNLGMTSAVSLDPLTTPIDDSNLAEIVKSAEGLAEIFRRVSTALTAAGYYRSLDSVVETIAADLVDGTLDGEGAVGTNRRVAATTRLVAAQVAIELMRNELRVSGQVVTPTLDDVVRQLASGTAPDLTETRPVNAYLVGTALGGVEAALALGGAGALVDTQTTLLGMQSGMTADTARSVLSATAATQLSAPITQIAAGSDAEINLVLDGTTEPPPPPPPPATNTPPSISGVPATLVSQDSFYSFTPTASDVDGDTLTFSITNKPGWATFSAQGGRISGTPTAADVGVYANIGIEVSDGQDTASLAAFAITVESTAPPPPPPPPTNTPPTIGGSPSSSVEEGNFYSFTPIASDADGDRLTFSVQNRPAWASFNSTTGRLSGTPGTSHVGTFTNIRISVSDAQATASLAAFSITVTAAPPPPNTPPTIGGIPPGAVLQDTSYGFTPTASDADGDTLTFSIQNQPSWANFNPTTGRLSGTPTASHVGTYSGISISVSDGEDSASLPAFSITVDAIALGSATLSWVAPTTNTDGSPLQDLAGYEIAWGVTSGIYPNSVTVMNPGITTYVVENLPNGTHFFAVKAINGNGLRSDFSNEASKTIP